MFVKFWLKHINNAKRHQGNDSCALNKNTVQLWRNYILSFMFGFMLPNKTKIKCHFYSLNFRLSCTSKEIERRDASNFK